MSESESLTPRDQAERIALFRAELIGAVSRRELGRGELAATLRALAAERYLPPRSKTLRYFGVSTFERWLYAYRAHGLAGLRPAPRSDGGRARDLTPEQRELLLEIRREHPTASVPLILRTLVDEHALEPRWRLPSWHTVRVDGRREVIRARNLDTLRERLAPQMLRRVRGNILAQLPPRRDLRISVELTDAQVATHDELDLPIARLVSQARRRPLTQAEFLQLMRLLNQQRMICNGMALRDFVEVWPTLERAGRRSDRMLAKLDSPKLVEFRDRITDLVVTHRHRSCLHENHGRRHQRISGAWRNGSARARIRSMTGRAHKVLEEALSLSEDERLDLAEQLLSSLPADPEWLAELERRARRALADPSGGEAWEVVERRLDARFASR